jgi:hypothetical protein
MVNKILGEKLLPETKYMLFKILRVNVSPSFFLECPKCLTIEYELKVNDHDNQEKYFTCSRCKDTVLIRSAKPSFVMFPIAELLADILKKNDHKLIFPNNNQTSQNISDTWDGLLHKKVLQKEGKFLSLICNTDGVQKYNSTKFSLYPLLVTVSNLPKNIRFRTENVLCAGFFYGKKINMDKFLEKFIMDLRKLNATGGIQLSNGKYKVFCLGSTVDSVAKPKLMKISQFNGFYSCPQCLIRGVRINKATKFPYRYIFKLIFIFWFQCFNFTVFISV